MLAGSIIDDIKHHLRYGNMVVKLIFINVAVFIFFGLLNLAGFIAQNNSVYTFLDGKLALSASLPLLLYQPWTVFTYMFMHDGIGHIFFNMLWLYWFGEIFVLYLGDKKVLPLYFIGGLAGALAFLLSFNLLPVFKPMISGPPMVGASASILAIVFAAATINPDHEVSLLFIGRVKLKYVAVVPLLIDIITIPYGNAGGYIAHIGGALSGYLYITGLQSGLDPVNSFLNFFKRKSPVKVAYKNTEAKTNSASRSNGEQQKVDEILDKIARSGYDSLSKEERDFLFNYSKK